MVLIDANVLVYALNTDAPQYEESRRLIAHAWKGDVPAVVVPQVLLEAYAVMTDPRRVGRPLDPVQAWTEIEAYRKGLRVLESGGEALDHLAEIVHQRRPSGQDIFDAAIVAQMRTHGVETICTFDASDFAGIPGITAATPRWLLRSLRLR